MHFLKTRALINLVIWCLFGWSIGALSESVDEESMEIPVDSHLSADPLPQHLLDDFECSCDSHKLSCHHLGKNLTCSEARICYFVLIHNTRTLEDAVHLFRAIRDPRNIILLHIDKKFEFMSYEVSQLRQEIEACPCGSHVEVASVHNASWGTWSMTAPTLWAMEKAVNDYAGRWDVFINLSGDSLPVYKADRIARILGGPLAGMNFVTSSACETGLVPTPITAFPKKWHKRSHYSHRPMSLTYVDDDGKTYSDVQMEIYFGSQWVMLLPDWCEYLVQQLQRPDSLPSQFRDYLIATQKLMTDETFIPTLLMYIQPESIPIVNEDYQLVLSNRTLEEFHKALKEPFEWYAVRYERMDEHVPNSKGWYPTEQRYDVPKESGVDIPKPWGPYYLGVYDLANIREYGALYIRKVATAIDPNIFHLLPVDLPSDIPNIEWPAEIRISNKPNWEKKVQEMKQQYLKEHKDKEMGIKKESIETQGNVKAGIDLGSSRNEKTDVEEIERSGESVDTKSSSSDIKDPLKGPNSEKEAEM